MVLDNVRFNHAKHIKEWLSGQSQLDLFFLLPYSPDLNAMEKAWWYMRKKITHKHYVRTMKERKALFWNLSDGTSKEVTSLAAFKMAVNNRRPAKGLIFHSDSGIL